MDPAEIPLGDRARWQNWMSCLAAMVDELRELKAPSVDQVLEKYSCKRVEFGFGMNVDWPEGDARAAKGLEAAVPVVKDESPH